MWLVDSRDVFFKTSYMPLHRGVYENEETEKLCVITFFPKGQGVTLLSCGYSAIP